ncbi:MAG: TatD family hydrolase, partial [Terriglobales bacterium]
MLIDSHCHPEQGAELESARDAGVGGLVCIADLEFARGHQDVNGLRVWATAGVHPHEAAAAAGAGWEQLRRQAEDPLTISIGEIGLDYHYDNSPRAAQLEAFERQLELAVELGLPVSVHCREAWDDCFRLIAAHPPPG